jgi:GTPase
VSKNKIHPKVLLVGRTNVGKSTLFNRLTSNKASIVFEREGVTRDYIEQNVEFDEKTFTLIDTGGFSLKKNAGAIEQEVQEKVKSLFGTTSLVLFVCDGKNGLTTEDALVARSIHKTKKRTILLINKADCIKAFEENLPDFYSLGFKDIVSVSGVHGIGTGRLLEKIVGIIPQSIVEELREPEYRVAIIGKPNVGKSSLMNLLIRKDRSIVSEIAGTTREAISERMYNCNDLIQITDTAGVRRKCRIDDDLESLMVKSSFRSVQGSDIIILMVDSTEGQLSDQELKLLFYARREHKPVIVIYNKTDLLDDYTKERLAKDIDRYDFVLDKIPQIAISCLTKKNVGKIFEQIKKLWIRCKQSFNSTQVDGIVKEILSKKQMFHKRKLLRLFKIRSVKTDVPMFVLHVNYPEWFGQNQLGFIENILRKNYDLKGCPIKFSVRKV